jgi:hypothetical protein
MRLYFSLIISLQFFALVWLLVPEFAFYAKATALVFTSLAVAFLEAPFIVIESLLFDQVVWSRYFCHTLATGIFEPLSICFWIKFWESGLGFKLALSTFSPLALICYS